MRTNPFCITLSLLLLLAACSSPEVEENHFEDARELRQSSLFKQDLVPREFVDILPPSVREIHSRICSADTVSHMKFRLTRLPDDYFTLISRMELALESEVEQLHPFEPEGAEWWNSEKVRAHFKDGSFVFRKLPLGVGDAVYVAAGEEGEVYAWIDR
ncbi:MAG: hypothetical protein J5I94_13665 [Phaeodactylibacter sp.]|nr:hypothetical protein [Phaeodactylibacter sp.]